MTKFKFTGQDINEMHECKQGVCLGCGHVEDEIGPEERSQPCSDCGRRRVMGIQAAVTRGKIEIEEDLPSNVINMRTWRYGS